MKIGPVADLLYPEDFPQAFDEKTLYKLNF